MNLVLIIVLTVIRVVATLIHGAGFYLLYNTRSTALCENQRLYLMNFSFSEIMLCVFSVIKRACQLSHETEAQDYVLIMQWTGLSLGYYISMILLTLDRLLKFVLDIKYAPFWTAKKTKQSIIISWVLVLVLLIFCLIFIPKNTKIITFIATVYLFSAFDITFVVVACLSYGFLYRTVRKVRKQRLLSQPSSGRPLTDRNYNLELERKAKEKRTTLSVLFVPTWIIITFLIFIMLPDQVYFYCFIMKKDLGHVGDIVISFTYCAGFVSDAFIYVFLSPPVRKTLMRIMRQRLSWLKPSKSESIERDRILTLRKEKSIERRQSTEFTPRYTLNNTEESNIFVPDRNGLNNSFTLDGIAIQLTIEDR